MFWSEASSLTREATLLGNRVLAQLERRRRPQELQSIAAAFAGRRVLEIGGPSPVFEAGGLLPVYPGLAGRDDANYAASTIWDGDAQKPGDDREFVAEATDLGVPDGSYDGLLASHVIEHVANPLRALREWTRVVAPGSPLLIIVPHRDFTFDHRRDVTPLEHLVEDEANDTGEDDLTHVEEMLERHDPTHDFFTGTREEFEQRTWDNATHRALHHHVFVTRSAVAMIAHAGLAIEAVSARRPHHIIVLARRAPVQPFEPVLAAALRHSPFPSDRGRR